MTKKQKMILWIGVGIAGFLLLVILIGGILIPTVLKSYFKLEHRDWIEQYSNAYEVDPYLVSAVIFCESKYRPDAISRAGARGLMQIMPATGAEIAEALGEAYDPDQLFDPETSIRYGTYYLRMQLDRFDNNPAVVLAAYNAGPHRAEQWVADYGLDSRGHICYIPFQETDHYVDKVLGAQKVYEALYRNAFSAGAEEE
ncbi:MAG: lytic transglycosylase domain-containing protein [Clostridia bacterium]|nr:lytic transglycosylase domain-containing protein [Clostridia bacterium]